MLACDLAEKTVLPTVPSAFLLGRFESNEPCGFTCFSWVYWNCVFNRTTQGVSTTSKSRSWWGSRTGVCGWEGSYLPTLSEWLEAIYPQKRPPWVGQLTLAAQSPKGWCWRLFAWSLLCNWVEVLRLRRVWVALFHVCPKNNVDQSG